MKKYFINILLFFIIVVAIDVLYGVALQYMNNHAKGGAIGNRCPDFWFITGEAPLCTKSY